MKKLYTAENISEAERKEKPLRTFSGIGINDMIKRCKKYNATSENSDMLVYDDGDLDSRWKITQYK